MSFTRVRPLGWSFGDKLAAAETTQIDLNVSRAIDKTVAGDTIAGTLTWASGAKIAMGSGSEGRFQSGSAAVFDSGSTATFDSGSLLYMQSSSTMRFNAGAIIVGVAELQGDLFVAGAGNVRTAFGGRFILGDNDWPEFFPSPRSRSILVPLVHLNPVKYAGTATWAVAANGSNHVGFQSSGAAGGYFMFYLPPLHAGATLSSVDIWFQPSVGARATLPGIQPTITVRKNDPFTQYGPLPANAYLSTTTIQSNSVASLANYTGLMQKMTYACNQNNVITQPGATYVVLIGDENGLNAIPGNSYLAVGLNFTTIADMRFP